MAISKKPKKDDFEEFILGGSSTKSERQEMPKQERILISLQVPSELLQDIDKARPKDKPELNRTQWILDACYKKLASLEEGK